MKIIKTIIIIGGGPAGMTCALQLKRYGLDPLLMEKRQLGGLLWNANLVENYPGFPNGVAGGKLVQLMQKQIERIGVRVEREEAERVDLKGDAFSVTTKNEQRAAQILVVASGTRSKPLPDVVSPDAHGKIFTEVWPLLKEEGKQIVVIGAGDAAFDYAINLAKKRNFVTILNRRETVKCLPLLAERAAREPRIVYRAGVAVSRVTVDESADRLEVRWEAESLKADYVLFAIGRVPNLGFLSDDIRRREKELVEAGRLYFIGDVKNDQFRQAAIAAGNGLRAAMEIYSQISNLHYKEKG